MLTPGFAHRTGERKCPRLGIVDFGRSSGSIPARPSTHDEHCAVLQELRGVAGASEGHAARGLKAAGSGIVKFGGRKGMALGAAAPNPPAMRTSPLGNGVDE